jgi:hypothetical protein
VFTFSSNQTAQPNFSFIVEVYIDGTLRLTQEVFRQFNTLGRIDVSEAVQSAIRNPEITTDLEFDATNSMVSYFIVVYEKYGTTPIIQASDQSTTLKAFNGALEYPQWRVWDYEIYDPNLTQNAVFLTNFPTTSRALCGMDENIYVGYFEQTASAPVSLFVQLDDIQDDTIISDYINLTSVEFNMLNVGPQVIIANSSITQNHFDNCYRYYVQVDVSGVSAVGPFIIYMDLDCKRYETRRLHWLNKLGSWDSFTFALVSTESATVQAFDYQRDPGVWDGTSYTYPLYSGQKIHFAKTKSKQLVLNSDWISQGVQNWLVESLFDSPLVYLEQNNGTEFEPVKVTNTSYQLKTRKRDGLMQEQITIDRTYTYRSQLN